MAAKVAGIRYKLLQILYAKKDGSIYISFPYFEHASGLVSLVTFQSTLQQPADLDLMPGGKVTSHRVKYSHHPDGRAHFSQDSKVRTEVLKLASPLADINGHFFTAQLQGLRYFKSEQESTTNNSQRSTLDFNFGEKEPDSIKIVGHLYSTEVLMRQMVGNAEGLVGPVVPVKTESGEKNLAFLVGDPNKRRHEKILLLTCNAIPQLDKNTDSALTFISGFDHIDKVTDPTINTTFLALSYPVSDYEGLRKNVGTIDIERDII